MATKAAILFQLFFLSCNFHPHPILLQMDFKNQIITLSDTNYFIYKVQIENDAADSPFYMAILNSEQPEGRISINLKHRNIYKYDIKGDYRNACEQEIINYNRTYITVWAYPKKSNLSEKHFSFNYSCNTDTVIAVESEKRSLP